jgi:hypothetical protein
LPTSSMRSFNPNVPSRNSMTTADLAQVTGLVFALSVATERLVEIIKGMRPTLNKEIVPPVATVSAPGETVPPDPNNVKEAEETEGRRKAKIQFISIGCGVLTSLLAYGAIKEQLKALNAESWLSANAWCLILTLGLMASGGSGFWNAITQYLLGVKDLKSLEAEAVKKRASL